VTFYRCKCSHCNVDMLVSAREYRCCMEVHPVVGILLFDGSIEHVSCITEHEDYPAMTNTAVLKQVAPFLRDKSGKKYRRQDGRSEKE